MEPKENQELTMHNIMRSGQDILDQIVEFQPKPNDEGFELRKKSLLRRTFEPIVYFLVVSDEQTAAQLNTPERIIGKAVKDPVLADDPNLSESLVQRYQLEDDPDADRQSDIDWSKEALELILEGAQNPLFRFSLKARSKLPENLQNEMLTRDMREVL